MSRTVTVDFDLIDAWEVWRIKITDPNAPEEITTGWLQDNQDSWEYVDLRDSGSGAFRVASVEGD